MSVLKANTIIVLVVIATFGASPVNGNDCINRFCKTEKLREITEHMNKKSTSGNVFEMILNLSDLTNIEEAYNFELSHGASNFSKCTAT